MQVTVTLNPNLMLRVTSLFTAICAGVYFEFCVLLNRSARCGSSMIFQGFCAVNSCFVSYAFILRRFFSGLKILKLHSMRKKINFAMDIPFGLKSFDS